MDRPGGQTLWSLPDTTIIYPGSTDTPDVYHLLPTEEM